MKILIAGATGLIGSELTKQCLAGGIGVNYLTTSKDKIWDRPNHKGFYWDPNKGRVDAAAFMGVTAVINLAGASIAKKWDRAEKEKILQSRVQSANCIYNFLKTNKTGVSHYISASGASIYPNSKTKLYHEGYDGVDSTFLANVVVAWEAAADKFKTLNIAVAKVRTGVVIAKKDSVLQKMATPIKKGFGAVLGSGKQWLSWVHVYDIAGVYLHILKKGLSGVYNGVAPNPVTNKKMTHCIADIEKKSIFLPKVPGFIVRLLLGEMAVLALKGQLVSSRKIQDSGY
ncbi:MAG: TIGR01777 family oxidoreductase, partial [Marinirhabdus sp.]